MQIQFNHSQTQNYADRQNNKQQVGFGTLVIFHETPQELRVADDPVRDLISKAIKKSGFKSLFVKTHGKDEKLLRMKLVGTDEQEAALQKKLWAESPSHVTYVERVPNEDEGKREKVNTAGAFINRLALAIEGFNSSH